MNIIFGVLCLMYIFSWMLAVADDLKDDIIFFIKYKIIKKFKKGTKDKFSTLKEMDDKLEILGKHGCPYYEIYGICYRIKSFPTKQCDNIKYFFQRGIRGYSDRDLWDFDYYLSEMIIKSVKQLKKQKHSTFRELADMDDKKMMKEHNIIFDKIITGFEIYTKNFNKSPGNYSKKQQIEYDEGWEIFKKYFPELSD